MEEPIRVAILSPILAVRIGLSTLLQTDEKIKIVSELSDTQNIDSDLEDVDVVILQGETNLEDWQPIPNEESQLALLWVTDNPQAAHILRGLPIHAWGIVSTEAPAEELIAACTALDQGLIVAPQWMLESLWGEPPDFDVGKLTESLTPRETEVLELLAQGLANKQIALALEISEHTVKFHISSIYGKLGVTNRTEAVRQGLKLGLTTL